MLTLVLVSLLMENKNNTKRGAFAKLTSDEEEEGDKDDGGDDYDSDVAV